jgi:hypothetical protein
MIDETLNQPAAPGAPMTPPQMEPQAAPPAPPPQEQAPAASAPKQSVWKSVVQGALVGLANSGGATSFGGGLGAGAQGVMNKRVQDQQMEMAQQREQRLAASSNSENLFRNAQAASLIADAKMKDQQLENLPETLRQKVYERESQLAQEFVQQGWMPSEIVDDNGEAAMDGLRRGAANSPDGKLGNRWTLHVGGKILAFDLDSSPESIVGKVNRATKLLGQKELAPGDLKALPATMKTRYLNLFNPVPNGTAAQVSEYKEYVAKAIMQGDEQNIADMKRAYEMVLEAKQGRDSKPQTNSRRPPVYIPMVNEKGEVTEWVNNQDPTVTVAAKPGQRKSPLPMQENADRASFGALGMQFKDLYTIIKKREDAVGPVAGRVGMARAEWIGGDKEAAAAYQQMDDIANQLIYLASGKQINEAEFKRLKKTFPGKELPYDTFMVRLDGFYKRMQRVYELRTGRKLPQKMSDAVQPAQPQTPQPQNTPQQETRTYQGATYAKQPDGSWRKQ